MLADRLSDSRYVAPGNLVFWPWKPIARAEEERLAPDQIRVPLVDR
jgi:hypothetical protein